MSSGLFCLMSSARSRNGYIKITSYDCCDVVASVDCLNSLAMLQGCLGFVATLGHSF